MCTRIWFRNRTTRLWVRWSRSIRQWTVWLGRFYGSRKGEFSRKEEANLRTPEILTFEEALSESRTELLAMRSSFNETIAELRNTVSQFSNLVRVFSSLAKIGTEFEDQKFSDWLKQEKQATLTFSFNFLKRTFDFSSESFETLILHFGDFVRNLESAVTDVGEVVVSIDVFMKNKEETINKIWTNHVL